MASHGDPEILTAPPTRKPQRPLSAEEKLARTTIDIESSPQSSEWDNTSRTGEKQPSPNQQEQQTYNSTPISQDGGILSRMRRWEAAMDRKLGIESQAIDRKGPEERIKKMGWRESLTMAALWASGTMNLSCFATGFLGWKFGLDLM